MSGGSGSDGPGGTGGQGDARTLSIKRSATGERNRSAKSCGEDSSEVTFDDWVVDGPRTAQWYVKEVGKTSMDRVARHSSWRHESGLKDGGRIKVSHEQ